MELQIGDRVGYSRKWLKSVGLSAKSPTAGEKGTIVAVDGPFVIVKWDSPHRPAEFQQTPVHPMNLAKVGSLAYCEVR